MYHRSACGIEDQDDNTMVITGGYDDGDRTARTTKYKDNGSFEDLPTLNNKRSSHGCGIYQNTNNVSSKKVRIIDIVTNYCNVLILGLPCGWRMVWLIPLIIYRDLFGRFRFMENRLTSAKKYVGTENRKSGQLHSNIW